MPARSVGSLKPKELATPTCCLLCDIFDIIVAALSVFQTILGVFCGAVVEVHVTRQKNHRHRICNLIVNKGVILTGPGSVWFGTVVILTHAVQ